MKRTAILVVFPLLLHLGACTATPITLPGGVNDGAWINRSDQGAQDGAAMADLMPTSPDISNSIPDSSGGADAGLPDGGADGTSMDALSDAVCLECPASDAMTEAGPGDAVAGPTLDALNDLAGSDLPGGD